MKLLSSALLILSLTVANWSLTVGEEKGPVASLRGGDGGQQSEVNSQRQLVPIPDAVPVMTVAKDTYIAGGDNKNVNYDGLSSMLVKKSSPTGDGSLDRRALLAVHATGMLERVERVILELTVLYTGSDSSRKITVSQIGGYYCKPFEAMRTWNYASKEDYFNGYFPRSSIVFDIPYTREKMKVYLDVTNIIPLGDYSKGSFYSGIDYLYMLENRGQPGGQSHVAFSTMEAGDEDAPRLFVGLKKEWTTYFDLVPRQDFFPSTSLVKDTYIQAGSYRNTNYDGQHYLMVKRQSTTGNDSSGDRKSLLIFNTTDFLWKNGTVWGVRDDIAKITLELTVRSTGSDASRNVTVKQLHSIYWDSSLLWPDAAVTWEQAANFDKNIETTSSSEDLTTFDVPSTSNGGNGKVYADVTSIMNGYAPYTNRLTFLLQANSGGSQSWATFYSQEAGIEYAPRLIVELKVPKTLELKPTQDTYICGGAFFLENFGDLAELRVEKKNNCTTLLRYDLPLGFEVTKAMLELTVSSLSEKTFTMTVREFLQTWDEKSITGYIMSGYPEGWEWLFVDVGFRREEETPEFEGGVNIRRRDEITSPEVLFDIKGATEGGAVGNVYRIDVTTLLLAGDRTLNCALEARLQKVGTGIFGGTFGTLNGDYVAFHSRDAGDSAPTLKLEGFSILRKGTIGNGIPRASANNTVAQKETSNLFNLPSNALVLPLGAGRRTSAGGSNAGMNGMYDELLTFVNGLNDQLDIGVLSPRIIKANEMQNLVYYGEKLKIGACTRMGFLNGTAVVGFGYQDQSGGGSGVGFCAAANTATNTYAIAQTHILPEIKLGPGGVITLAVNALGVSVSRQLAHESLNLLWDGSGVPVRKQQYGHFLLDATAAIAFDVEKVKVTVSVDPLTLLIDAGDSDRSPLNDDSVDFVVLMTGVAKPTFKFDAKDKDGNIKERTIELYKAVKGEADLYFKFADNTAQLQLAASLSINLGGICDILEETKILCEIFSRNSNLQIAFRAYAATQGFGMQYAVKGELGLAEQWKFLEAFLGWPAGMASVTAEFSIQLMPDISVKVCVSVHEGEKRDPLCFHTCKDDNSCEAGKTCRSDLPNIIPNTCMPKSGAGGGCTKDSDCGKVNGVQFICAQPFGTCEECSTEKEQNCGSSKYCGISIGRQKCIDKKNVGELCDFGGDKACKSGFCRGVVCTKCGTAHSTANCNNDEFCNDFFNCEKKRKSWKDETCFLCLNGCGWGCAGTCTSGNHCQSGKCCWNGWCC